MIFWCVQLPYVSGNGRDEIEENHAGGSSALDEAEDDAPDVELPPPMKPIQVRFRCLLKTFKLPIVR